MAGLNLRGDTSGSVEIVSPAVAGDNTITLPNDNGSANQFFKNSTTAGIVTHSSMVELKNRNIGVGTANPGERLHLTTTSGNCKLRIDAASAASVDFYNSGTRLSDMFTDASTSNFTITNRQNADIIIRTNGTNERLRITNAGVTSVTGSLSVNDNFYPTAGPLSNRNLIINGAMNIAQRGTSSTDEGYQTVDRYFIQRSGGTVTQTQTGISSGSPYDEGFRNVVRQTNTGTTTGADSHRNTFQYIEAQNLAQSGWNYTSSSSYVTLSFWVRSSVGQEFYGYLRTFDGTEQGYSFSTGTLSADTWTKVTKTIPGNSNITIDNNNGTGLQVNISPFWGTTYTDSGNTLESWAAFSSGSRTPDYTNTWANTTNATFDITGLQLEVGERATPFEHRSYADDLQRCLRYTYVLGSQNVTDNFERFDLGICNSSTTTRVFIKHPVMMRTAPTVSTPDATQFQVSDTMTGYDASALSRMSSTNGPLHTSIQVTHQSGTTTNRSYILERNNSTSGRIIFSAEL